MSEHDRVLIESLLRAVRGFRHASHAAELAILKWMEARGYLPDPATQKDGGTGDRKVR